MATHKMNLQKPPFEKIVNGQKNIEARLFDEKRRQIKVGDIIEFTQNEGETKKILTKVVKMHRYKSFGEMFSNLPIEQFGGNSKEEMLKMMREFYSTDEENKYGVVGIEIEQTK